MLRVITKYSELDTEMLRDVYAGSLPEGSQTADYMDLLDYLSGVFFEDKSARMLIWEEQGRYVSALRIEPYRDGLLLSGLETAPSKRNRGFAASLVRATLEELGTEFHCRVYSHINKRNHRSLHVHEKCGFTKLLDYAAFIDGTVSANSVTMAADI